MSKIEEIEQAVEQLPPRDFVKLTLWVDRRRQRLENLHPIRNQSREIVRDHSAF
jgi:hypothetical protein